MATIISIVSRRIHIYRICHALTGIWLTLWASGFDALALCLVRFNSMAFGTHPPRLCEHVISVVFSILHLDPLIMYGISRVSGWAGSGSDLARQCRSRSLQLAECTFSQKSRVHKSFRSIRKPLTLGAELGREGLAQARKIYSLRDLSKLWIPWT